MSEPRAAIHKSAAIAAAEPPEDPPGTRILSQGFFVGPLKLDSVEDPKANSSILALPKIIKPASFNFLMA